MRFESGEVKVRGLRVTMRLRAGLASGVSVGSIAAARRGRSAGCSLEAVAACSLTGGAGWASIPGWSFPDNLMSIRQTAIQPQCALTGLAQAAFPDRRLPALAGRRIG